jgi:hypothetical protein
MLLVAPPEFSPESGLALSCPFAAIDPMRFGAAALGIPPINNLANSGAGTGLLK